MLDDYAILDELYRGPVTCVTRCRGREGKGSVVVKSVVPEAYTLSQHARLVAEYRALEAQAAARVPCTPKPLELIDRPGEVAIVTDDLGGQATRLLQPRLDVDTVIEIGVQVARSLGTMHQARWLHKDVNPSNIIYNPDTRAVQLIDFGLATPTAQELYELTTPTSMEGTLPYMAPEQTGRANRPSDHRSDFYALGATLYELLTGERLFENDDIVQLLYAILATPAPDVRARLPSCPMPLAQIVAKLLEKTPEARYQSAYGLIHDLHHARGAAPLTPGSQDRNERFELPPKLYGRTYALDTLRETYHQAVEVQSALVLVRGPSGIGKSTLVRALQRDPAAQKAVFAEGKFDQLRRHIPFGAFSMALTALTRRLLQQPEAALEVWRRRLQEAIGTVGQALVEVAPALEVLVGRQPALPELPPQQNESRLVWLLQRFVQALCAREPLILFIDDLQWADSASLKLLSALASHPGRGLLVVAAYRSDEVQAAHPLAETIEKLNAARRAAQRSEVPSIELQPMRGDEVSALLQDATHAAADLTAPLAHRIIAKTAGNPFFVRQCLRDLHARHLLRYDLAWGLWRWDMAQIDSTPVTSNVVALLTETLRALSASQQRTLSLAACLGSTFVVGALASLMEISVEDLMQRLGVSQQAGLVVALRGNQRYGEAARAEFRFGHDQVQEAAYLLLPPEDRLSTHHRIGMRIWQERREQPAHLWVFEALEHLNRAALLVVQDPERLELATLNLLAAREAKRSAAYAAALAYLLHGMPLLPADAWQSHYALRRDFSLELAECAYLAGDILEATPHLDEGLRNVRLPEERAELHRRRLLCMTTLRRDREAVDAGVAALAELGYRVPRKPGAYHVALWVARVRWGMRGRDIKSLATQHEATDPRLLRVAQILVELLHPAYVCDGRLFTVLTLMSGVLHIEHGNTPTAAVSYAGISAALSTLGQFAPAHDFAAAARLRRANTAGLLDHRSEVAALTFTEFVSFKPYQVVESALHAGSVAEEHGDVLYAGLGPVLAATMLGYVQVDQTLDLVQRKLSWYESRESEAGAVMDSIAQYCRCLRGETRSAVDWTDTGANPSFKQGDWEQVMEMMPNNTSASYCNLRAVAAAAYGDFDTALMCAQRSRRLGLFEHMSGMPPAVMSFFASLAILRRARARVDHAVQDGALLRKCRRHLRVLTSDVPHIWGGLVTLIDAEAAALRGDALQALSLYETSLPSLEASGYTAFAAIGYECAGVYCLERGMQVAGEAHLRRAYALYGRWGAAGKTRAMASVHGFLRAVPASDDAPASGRRRNPEATSNGIKADKLEGDVLWSLTEALMGEARLFALMEKVMDAARDITGATRAVLMLKQASRMQVQHDTAGPAAGLPQEIVQYVTRTQEPVLLDDVQRHGTFSHDPYWANKGTHAVMCVPLLHQAQLRGLVYLENDQTSNAFTPARLQAARVLAAQATILLENAALQGDFERAVRERTLAVVGEHGRAVAQERDAVGMQIAGGFAHEMRNALSPVLYSLGSTFDPRDGAFHAHEEDMLKVIDQLAHTDAEGSEELRQRLADQMNIAREILNQVYRSVKRGIALTEQTLEYANAAQILPGDHATEVKPLLDMLLGEMHGDLMKQHIDVAVESDDALRIPMQATHAVTILRHLLSNARDALSQRPRNFERRILVRATRSEHHVMVSVVDNGVGINPALSNRVFQPFFSTKGAQGRGLGLGISRKLAQVYGGYIDFDSEPERGSTFNVLLPNRPDVRPGQR